MNQLTGTLPEAYGAFKPLEKLLLSENHLTGALPEVGGSWSKVKEIWAEYNGFEVRSFDTFYFVFLVFYLSNVILKRGLLLVWVPSRPAGIALSAVFL